MGYKIHRWAGQVVLAAGWISLWAGATTYIYEETFFAIIQFGIALLTIPFLYPFRFLPGPILLLWYKSYLVSAIFAAGLSVICFFQPPTVITGLTLAIGAVLYGVSAFRKEESETSASVKARWY